MQCTAISLSQFEPSLLTLLPTSSVLALLAFVDKISLSFLRVLVLNGHTPLYILRSSFGGQEEFQGVRLKSKMGDKVIENFTKFREGAKGSGKSYSMTMSLNDRCVCVCVNVCDRCVCVCDHDGRLNQITQLTYNSALH